MACILLCSSAVRIHDSQTYRKKCDRGAHQSHIGTKRNVPVVPNWFQPCQCCCCLCYPGKYLRLETFVSTTQPRSLKLVTPRPLSVYFDLLVDAAGAVFHPRGLLGACRDAQLNLPVLRSPLLSHRCCRQSGDLRFSASNSDSAFVIF